MVLENPAIREHPFLKEMFDDTYFPNHLVEKGRQILLELCARIEREKPEDLPAVYALTHDATERFNDLAHEFFEHGSEIETAARETIARDIAFILSSYGFEVDLEEAIAPRDW